MQGTPPKTPPRTSSILSQVQQIQQTSELNITDIVNNPKNYDATVRAQIARHIIGNSGCEADLVFAAVQVMRDLDSFTTDEIVKEINFIIRNHLLFNDDQFIFAVRKMINYHQSYREQFDKGLVKDNTPHFSSGDFQLAAEVFIKKHDSFFTASPAQAAQFLSFAKTGTDKTDIVNSYRDPLFELLGTLGVEEQALELWKTGKFVEAPALSVEISLFILKNIYHEVFTLWDNFILPKQNPALVIPNLY